MQEVLDPELDKVEKVVQRGKRAKAMQSDPVIQEAFVSLRDKQLKIIESASPERQDVRENAFFMLKALQVLQTELEAFIGNGIMEEHNLQKRRG